jgi:hypothetical protein
LEHKSEKNLLSWSNGLRTFSGRSLRNAIGRSFWNITWQSWVLSPVIFHWSRTTHSLVCEAYPSGILMLCKNLRSNIFLASYISRESIICGA